MIGGAGLMLPLRFLPRKAFGIPLAAGLSDPALQPKFVELAPNALDPGFLFKDFGGTPSQKPNFHIKASKTKQQTGLIDPSTGKKVTTDLWGYGQNTVSWPGQTIQVVSSLAGGAEETVVQWDNKIRDKSHLLPVDTSLHWAYSLHGASSANGVDYRQFSIAANGVPTITHLHGGNSDFQFDGNPEFFYSPNGKVTGPQWDSVPGGFTNTFRYNNAVPAGNLWYHDHALGITRLNVYAGLAGFYFVRDDQDTGLPDNPLGLPAFPYELAYAIQDRMFRNTGELFYPAFPGDPFYEDFITGEGVTLGPPEFPDPPPDGGGPTALAEFFGDHMVVNGKIWPKENVMPRNYRMHLLNGTDSRFMVIRFRAVPAGATDLTNAGAPIPFYVIGSDQGLASSATTTDMLLSEPGSRYDIVFDFKSLQGARIIMENIGGDEPFGGDIPGPQVFGETDRIMAFDVADVPDIPDGFNAANIGPYAGNSNTVNRVRKVALFEGTDEFGRLQPLLGTAEPATDYLGNAINWPTTPPYVDAGLVGQMEGSIGWHSPTTENPALDSTEIWEIYNATGDGHPIHLHLVNFEILDRQEFTADVIDQPVVQHNGLLGNGFRLENIQLGAMVPQPAGYVENAPKDMVTALPEQVTRIKATFDKPGRYVWHCHILSHEDHEMMRVLQVGPPA
jgi:FtsP/CotA-like multicopper oxidase with cupredoxin domain